MKDGETCYCEKYVKTLEKLNHVREVSAKLIKEKRELEDNKEVRNWVYCYEKLPKEEKNVLITFRNSVGIHVGEAYSKEGKFLEYNYIEEDDQTKTYVSEYNCVIAWMDLPSPCEE